MFREYTLDSIPVFFAPSYVRHSPNLLIVTNKPEFFFRDERTTTYPQSLPGRGPAGELARMRAFGLCFLFGGFVCALDQQWVDARREDGTVQVRVFDAGGEKPEAASAARARDVR